MFFLTVPEVHQYAEENGLAYIVRSAEDGIMMKIAKELDIGYDMNHTPIIADRRPYSIELNKLDKNIKSEEHVKFEFQTVLNKDVHPYGSVVHNIVIYGPSAKLLNKLIAYFNRDKHEITGRIYEWSQPHNQYITDKKVCHKVDITDLQGLDSYFVDVKKDIETLQEKEECLLKLGNTSGFNYLLYGEPGTGKSSFVKALAHHLKCPLYCVKLHAIDPESLSKALAPSDIFNNDSWSPVFDDDSDDETNEVPETPKHKVGIRIVLIEDFDRYISDCSSGIITSNQDIFDVGNRIADNFSSLSELLNALDGVYPAYGVIRFFSANHPEKIIKNLALKTRMRRILQFESPNIDQITKHLINTFPEPEYRDHINKFVSFVSKKKFPMRVINHYISRFLMDPNPIKSANDHIQEWFDELHKIERDELKKKRDDLKKKNKKKRIYKKKQNNIKNNTEKEE